MLVFLIDDMGWQDTSLPFLHDAAGTPVTTDLNRRYRTPHMEALAAGGMIFTRAYAHPVCTPSRITLMTGKNPARHRVTNWTNPAGTENGDNDVKHLRSPDGWGKTGIAADEKQPFFAYMAHYAVHSPSQADPRFAKNYTDLPKPQQAYASLIEGMDHSLGDILANLDTLGIAENTFVVFLSDNGGDAPLPNDKRVPVVSGNAPLRGKKGTRYEGGIRVPMIAAWAKPAAGRAAQERLKVPAGSHHDGLVSIADRFPTLLETAGVSGVPSFDGHDLRPALKGGPATRPQWLVTRYPHGHNNGHFSIYHEGDWKFIRNHPDGSAELYNLASDLAESTNLAKKQPERAAAMLEELERQLADYGALRSKEIGAEGR